MKVTVRGGLTLAGCLVITISNFITTAMWVMLSLGFVKYVFGEGPALLGYRLSAAYHNFLQRGYFAWVGGLLELGLGTRVAYTVVDGAGQEHLDQHFLTAVANEDGSVERRVDLDKYLRPPSQPGKAKIIIMNHHCRLDWLYMFIFFSRTRGIVSHIRFVLKGDLRQLPLLGWVMEMFRYLFLSRSWENDERYIQQMVNFYKKTNDTPVIFIFPEGTDLSPTNIERSQAFAAKSNLPKFHRVLNPRTTGLTALVKMLGGAEGVEEILDFTLGYTYHAPGERPNEPALVNGHHPKKVHLLCHRYVVEGTAEAAHTDPKYIVPTEETKLAAWTHARFAEKEQLLSRFLVSNPIGFDAADVRAVLGKQVGVASFDSDEERVRHPDRPRWRRYVQQVGLFGAVWAPLYYSLPLLYLLLSWRWWALLLWTVVVMVSFGKAIKLIGGLQRVLFVSEVTPEKTAMQRLRRWLDAQQGKETKQD